MTDIHDDVCDVSHRIESRAPTSVSSSLATISTLLDEDDVEDVPLRIIHGASTEYDGSSAILEHRIQLAEYRAEFWEAYAKEILSLYRKKKDISDCTNQDSLKDLYQKQYEEMGSQIKDLIENIEKLKANQIKEQEKSIELQEELKRAERVKKSYKKQVKDLTDLLEEAKYPMSSHIITDQNAQREIVSLQSKVTNMRLQIEGYKSQIDQERVERNIVQGKLDDLQDRYKRREIALDRAQKRCRKLDSCVHTLKKQNEMQKNARELVDTCEQEASGITSAVETPSTCVLIKQEKVEEEEDQQQQKEEEETEQETASDNAEPEDPLQQCTDQTPSDSSPVESVLLQDVVNNNPPIKINQDADEIKVDSKGMCEDIGAGTMEYNYARIFGEFELMHVEHVIRTADESLLQCISKIKSLSKMLEDSDKELNSLKGTCAYQYDQIFRYKNTCTSLKAKLQFLENHITKLQESSREYEVQMEHLVEQQRKSAAEESYALTSELQHMSQEQARLLLKLHAVEVDLDKSRAICRQLMRRVHILEHTKDRDSPAPATHPENSCRMPSSPCSTPQADISVFNPTASDPAGIPAGNIVSKLQQIAQGLRGLSSPRATSGNEPIQEIS